MQRPNKLRVFRPLNLLFLAVLQLLTYYFLDFNAVNFDLNLGLILLVVSTIIIAAAGYLINDHYDRIADGFNKPDNMPIVGWNARQIGITYLSLNVFALIGGSFLGIRTFIIFAFIIVLLWLYSFKLKQLPFIGNLVISVFAFLSVYIVYDIFQTQSKSFVVFFAVLAALFTFLREVAKDIEDMVGDKQAHYHTFPVMAGFLSAKFFLLSSTIFTAALYLSFQYQWVGHFFKGKLLLVFVGYQLLCIILPLLVIILFMYKANNTSQMHRISSLIKYVMATGILSMVFF